MKWRSSALLGVMLLVSFAAGAQTKSGKAGSAQPPASIETLIQQGKISEAVRLARKSPTEASATIKKLLEATDARIGERQTSEAESALKKTEQFLDALDKATGKPAPRDPLKARMLRLQGIQLNAKREFDKSEGVLKEALQLAQKLKDELLECGIRNNLGVSLQSQDKLEESRKEFELSAGQAQKLKDPLRAGSALFNLGVTEDRLKKSEPALEAFREAEKQFRSAGKSDLEARAILMQGSMASKINAASPDALKQFERARAIFLKLGDDRNLGWSYYLAADHTAYGQKWADAAGLAELALPHLTKAGDKPGLLRCYDLLVDMHGRTGKKDLVEKYKKLADEAAKP